MDAAVKSWEFAWASAGRSKASMKNMRRELAGFERWLKSHERADLRTASRVGDCEEWLAPRRAVSAATSHMAWRGLRSFYGFLAEEDDAANPMHHVKAPKVPEPVTKVVTEERYRALQAHVTRELKKCDGRVSDELFEWRRAAAILSVLWDTGLRRGELANLTMDDLDMDTGHLIVRTSKIGKPRVVPFTVAVSGRLTDVSDGRGRLDITGDPWAVHALRSWPGGRE